MEAVIGSMVGAGICAFCALCIWCRLQRQRRSSSVNAQALHDKKQNNYNSVGRDSMDTMNQSMYGVPSDGSYPDDEENGMNNDNIDTATELIHIDIQDAKQRQMVLKAMRDMRRWRLICILIIMNYYCEYIIFV